MPPPVLAHTAAMGAEWHGYGGLSIARRVFRLIADAPAEIAVIAYLSQDLRLIGLDHVAGTRDAVPLRPGAIAAAALRCAAHQVVVAHNHLSGDPTPSHADLAFARDLARALRTVNARLADIVILGDGRRSSLRALGLV